MNWLRLYTETVKDRKLRRLPVAYRWLWIAVLCIARESPVPGVLLMSESTPATDGDIADVAFISLDDVTGGLLALRSLGMTRWDDEKNAWAVTKWNKRQFQSDDATQRTRTYRERVKNVPYTFPLPDTGNGPEAEAETEAETDLHTTYAVPNDGDGSSQSAVPVKKPRDDQVLFAALMQEFGYKPANSNERGKWNKAIKVMRETDPPVRPDEIPKLCQHYGQVFPNAPCTPMALASNVGLLRQQPSRNGHKGTAWRGDTPRYLSPKEAADVYPDHRT